MFFSPLRRSVRRFSHSALGSRIARVYEPYLGLKSNGKVRALVFEKLIFRFTQPNQVNDPFEIRPRVPMEAYTEEDIDRARERALKAGFPKENLDQCLGIFFEDLTETNDGG